VRTPPFSKLRFVSINCDSRKAAERFIPKKGGSTYCEFTNHIGSLTSLDSTTPSDIKTNRVDGRSSFDYTISN
jgi:hypothetical protein